MTRIAALLLLLAGCQGWAGKGLAEVDGVLIPQADGVVDAEEGATLAIPAGTQTAGVALPAGDPIRLAIHNDVPWSEVEALLARIEAADRRAVLLVGRRHRVFAFRLEEQLRTDEPITVHTHSDGKVCVSPPADKPPLRCAGLPTADQISSGSCCAQSPGYRHVDRAYTREFVREQVQDYDVKDVAVEAPGDLSWADVVRAVDGARTCCGETVIRVGLAR